MGSQPQSRERGFYRIGGAQMLPLLFRIVVKRHHLIPVLVDQGRRRFQSFLVAPVLKSPLQPGRFLARLGIRDLPQHQESRLVMTLGDLGALWALSR